MGRDVVKVCIILPPRTILMKETGNKVWSMGKEKYHTTTNQNTQVNFSMIWGRDMVKWRTAQRTAMKGNGKTTRSKEKEQWFG